MGEARGNRFDDIKARLKEAMGNDEGDVDFESVKARLRESAERADQDIDADALIARAREAVGSVEGKVDAGKIRAWIDDVDRETVQGWMGEAKTAAASAAAFASAQGERLAERAPGVFDKVLGAAKEAIGDVTGNEGLTREGELQHLKGDIQSRYAETADAVVTKAEDVADAARAKREGSAG
jgi:uncharacterized protein YjbJ (UPF0337 family)